MRQLALSALLLALAGCSSTPVIINTFEGAPQATAIIKPVAFIIIYKIDDKNYYISPSGGFTKEFELGFLPGEHTFQLGYADGTSTSRKTSELQVKVDAGHRYIIRPAFDKNAWFPVLVDVTTRPECWTNHVGTGLGPKNCGVL